MLHMIYWHFNQFRLYLFIVILTNISQPLKIHKYKKTQDLCLQLSSQWSIYKDTLYSTIYSLKALADQCLKRVQLINYSCCN